MHVHCILNFSIFCLFWINKCSHFPAEGNEEGHFAIHQTTGLVSVATGQMLNRTEAIAYALSIEAADNGQPPKTGTATLIIGVCSAGRTTETSITRVLLILVFIFTSALWAGFIEYQWSMNICKHNLSSLNIVIKVEEKHFLTKCKCLDVIIMKLKF